jgi:excisionase family DNA binding protein
MTANRATATDGDHDSRSDPLLRPEEAARMFGVRSKTLASWARSGKVRCVLTVGGHRRYRTSDIRSLLEQSNDRT